MALHEYILDFTFLAQKSAHISTPVSAVSEPNLYISLVEMIEDTSQSLTIGIVLHLALIDFAG